MHTSRAGEQLSLFTGRVMRELTVSVPWEGRSPRALTRVALSGIFKARAAKSMSEFVDVEQGDFWLPIKKRPRRSSPGAPSLLPLPKRW